MSEWQPIETAKKDGTRMLGAFGAAGVCIFKRHDPGGRYESWVTDEGANCRAPTRWMPLPPPPTEQTSDTNRPHLKSGAVPKSET